MKQLDRLGSLVPLDPGILAVVETCQRIADNLEVLGTLANAHDLTGLYCIAGYAYHLTVNGNVLVVDQLAGSTTGASDTQTEHYVVQTALEVLQENLTGNAAGTCSLLEHVAELLLQNAVGVLGLLLLSQHHAVLGGLAATVVAVLAGREVSA